MDTDAIAAASKAVSTPTQRDARNDYHIDVTAMLGLLVLGIIGIIAVLKGSDGNTVAAAVVGGIAGWLAKASSKTANVTGDNPVVQPDAAS